MQLRFTQPSNEYGDLKKGDLITYDPWPHTWRGMTEPERVAKGLFIHCGGHGEFEVFKIGENVEVVN